MGQQKFARLAGTDLVGKTDEEGVQRALLGAGFVPEEYKSNSPAAALIWLRVQAMAGLPVLLCVAKEAHWVTVVGVFGKRFVVFDPARWEYRVESGVTIKPADALRRWWRANDAVNRRARQVYYALAVYDPQ